MASIRREREVLFKAGSQFEITGIEDGARAPRAPRFRTAPGARDQPQWIVHAEEIAPGDPRHLGEADARARHRERRAEERADEDAPPAGMADEELEQFYAEHPQLQADRRPVQAARLRRRRAPPLPERRAAGHRGARGGWSRLAEPLDAGGPPVLHAGSVETPQQHARLVRDAVPELGAVNTRNHYRPAPSKTATGPTPPSRWPPSSGG